MHKDQIQLIASRHGFSPEAVSQLYQAMLVGRGAMAQFSHPELGGTGQWMRGGMIMIGDMFNNALKARVEALCNDLAQLPRSVPATSGEFAFPPFPTVAASWWPADLGQPAAVGGQNDLAYAYFPAKQCLAIRHGDSIIIYDSAGYTITGFSQQQQPGIQGLYFTSQQGVIAVIALPVVESRRV
jgi:hypothetical protein